MALVCASSTFVTSANLSAAVASGSITVTTGDVVTVKLASEDFLTSLQAPTCAGQTLTSRVSFTASGGCCAYIYTMVIAGSPGTVIVGNLQRSAGLAFFGGMTINRWTGAQLAATPAVNATGGPTNGSGGGFAGAITTAAANSAVDWVMADWTAQAPGTIGYSSSATQDGLDDRSTANYVGYFAHQTAGAAGAQTFGTTSPAGTGTWTYAGIEIQAAGGAPAAYPFGITTPTPRYR